jgi:aminoglycoside phosphotransferase (APT) family kinase protein
MKDRYAQRTGRDLGAIQFYVAFGYWKLACILQGVQARYAGGAGGGDRSGSDQFGPRVRQLAEKSQEAVEQLTGAGPG